MRRSRSRGPPRSRATSATGTAPRRCARSCCDGRRRHSTRRPPPIAAKEQFLAILSHELRTPLAAMLGWTQMLRNRQVPAERTQHALDVIHRNTVLQARLIDDLLDEPRLQHGVPMDDVERVL